MRKDLSNHSSFLQKTDWGLALHLIFLNLSGRVQVIRLHLILLKSILILKLAGSCDKSEKYNNGDNIMIFFPT